MNHLVNKLHFEVHCREETFALMLRHRFASTIQQKIEQAIDNVCSKHSGKHQHFRIDRVEVNLGKVSPYSFDGNFEDLFVSRFEAELLSRLDALPTAERDHSTSRSAVELLQYFLQTGRLPWWTDESDTHLDEVVSGVLRSEYDSFERFLSVNRHNNVVWERVAYQLSVNVKQKIISSFNILAKTWDVLHVAVSHFINENGGKVSTGIEGTMTDAVIASAPAIFGNPESADKLCRVVLDVIKAARPSAPILSIDEVTRKFKADFSSVVDDPKQDFTSELKFIEQNLDANEKLSVRHSGLVLLAPFLKAFFTRLELLHGNEWKNKDAQYQAVHLLRFLTAGDLAAPEYGLTLEKIFCGIFIDEPVPRDVAISDQVIHEAAVLLESVIDHWKVLKNTSIEGLRASFLKRDGLLMKKDGHWHLQVERKAVDVLLDKIPWGYSVIILPWNEYLIYVEW